MNTSTTNTSTTNTDELLRKMSYAKESDPWLKRQTIRTLEWASGKRKLDRLFVSMWEKLPQSENCWAACLAELRIALDYEKAKLARVPKDVPLIFVANHPFGIVDGFAAFLLAERARDHFQAFIYQPIYDAVSEQVGHYLLPIDFAGTRAAARTNQQSKREAQATLEQGGTLVIFPSGGVQRTPSLFAPPAETEWKLSTAKLVQVTGATVVPLFFHGRNSWLFYAANHVSLTLRMGMSFREVLNKMDSTIRIEIGNPIPYEKMASFKGRRALTQFLRQRTFALAHSS